MKCPYCGHPESKVIDSRPVEENSSIRRRRECLGCQARFTTYEVIETFQPVVVKKDGSREYFDRNKLLVGILKACQKRPVDAQQIAKKVEADLQNSLKLEVTSKELGEMVMEELKKINRIIDKEMPEAYRENLIVLDGTTGQNALSQLREFKEAADVTGIILTKMDGTAKGGIAVAIQAEYGIPVKYIGVGETIDDLQKFDSDEFVNALFDVDDKKEDEEC